MDEVLLECDKGLGIEAGKVAMDCYTQAGIDLHNYYKGNLHIYSGGGQPKIVCDFAGSYSVGENYFLCH